MNKEQQQKAIDSARFILEDLNESGREKLADLTGLPLGVIVAAWENIFPERQISLPQIDEPKMSFKLKTLVLNDAACDELGLNPWCVAEGADGEEEIKIKLSQAKKWGLI